MNQIQWIDKKGILDRLQGLEEQIKKLEETFEVRLKEEKEVQKNKILLDLERIKGTLEQIIRNNRDILWSNKLYHPRQAI